MAEKSKTCPECGALMGFRLGQFECGQCGHEESAAEPEPERDPRRPGLKQPWQRPRGDAWREPAAERDPRRPGLIEQPVPPPGTLYTPGAAPPADAFEPEYGPPPAPGTDILTIEKHVYMGLQVFGTIGACVLLAAGGVMAAVPEAGPALGGAIFGSLVGLAILAFVLYSEVIWAKYCCAGCAVVSFFMVMVGMCAMQADLAQAGIPGVGAIQFWFIVVPQTLITLWFFSILWRDIQRLQGR